MNQPLTPEQQQKVIDIYERLSVTKTVHPSYRVLARAAKCSLGTAHRVIKRYLAQKDKKNVK